MQETDFAKIAKSIESDDKGELLTHSNDSLNSPDLICGADRNVVERFLALIKEHYHQADTATFYLEQRTGIINVHAITNLRDVLSHLATLLTPGLSPDQQVAQLSNAEEHLRRAIIEPYEVALNELVIRFRDLFKKYKEELLAAQGRYSDLTAAPSAASIESRMKTLANLIANGRRSKGINLWDPEWERAVSSYVEAFEALSALYSEVEGFWYKYEQLERDSSSSKRMAALELDVETAMRELQLESQKAKRISIAFTIVSVILLIALLAVILKR